MLNLVNIRNGWIDNMRNDLVSIVVPIYNQEKYLDRSISSLLSQKYNNIEIILFNDGSTDNSVEIINKYIKEDKRIKYFYKNNGGLVSAIVEGVKMSTGKYICFLDPDDFIGDNFILNFINKMDDDIDVIACGFYREYKGKFSPVYLKEDCILFDDKIQNLKNNFMLDSDFRLSYKIFISRWNKIYKKAVIEKFINIFEKCKYVSLGEDTIFTYLTLCNSKKIKILKSPNEYFYNITNQNSMMNNDKLISFYHKSIDAYNCFKNLMTSNDETTECLKQSSYLYYFLMNAIYEKNRNLKMDKLYKEVLNKFIIESKGISKIKFILKKNKFISFHLKKVVFSLKKFLKFLFFNLIQIKMFVITLKKGITYSLRRYSHNIKRNNAFKDLKRLSSIVIERIEKIIDNFEDKFTSTSNFNEIDKNIFVFWWDGFENAPFVVQKCIESVEKYFINYNIIKIDKNNYSKFTDINSLIIENFEKGKISIQTFSDILRFNLLKNNGGMWIDSTILFNDEYNLFSNLEYKDFESINFSSSAYFYSYEDEICSWSGYFILSRKNGYFVSLMNTIFEEYFLKYGTYSLYFFIDVAFMACKRKKVDNDILNKTHYSPYDMFLLQNISLNQYDSYVYEVLKKIPQKLSWNSKIVPQSFLTSIIYEKDDVKL